MADGIRLDLQRALAEGPGAIPNLEPLFAPGAIPPVFDEAPEVQEGPGFAPEEQPIAPPGSSVGQPVPPVKESRGDRLRALLGNFLQNFGTGLQAASRAPSGAEFAAGFGGALSAGEERRQQKSREDLLRANQASREEIARENIRLRQEDFEADEREREARRIERDLDRAESTRRFEETGRRRSMRDILESNRARRARSGEREFRRGERREDKEFRRELNRLGFRQQKELVGLKFENNLKLLKVKAGSLSKSEKDKLTQFSAAEAVLDSLEESLENFINTSPLNFGAFVKARNRFNAEASGFTRLIGRAVGEKGVFTDADKADFEELISPGTILTLASPDLARERIQRLRQLFQGIKEKQISAVGGQTQEGAGGISEGTIIRNPQTGQRLERRNGQWVPVQ